MSYWGWKFKFTTRIWLSKIIVRQLSSKLLLDWISVKFFIREIYSKKIIIRSGFTVHGITVYGWYCSLALTVHDGLLFMWCCLCAHEQWTLTWRGWWSSKKVCHYIGRYICTLCVCAGSTFYSSTSTRVNLFLFSIPSGSHLHRIN
jgi:hypothetical protein